MLYWCRHNDPGGGAPGFANVVAGKQIGVDWNGFPTRRSSGLGVIYAIDPGGKMFWYRHNDPAGGAPGFANGGAGKQTGDGRYGYDKVCSRGGGVIYAIDPGGKMFWYRHNDPAGGAPGFAQGGA